jgi:hypothetical protein
MEPMKKCVSLSITVMLIVAAAACTQSTSTQPSQVAANAQPSSATTDSVQPTSVTDVKTGITLTAPQLLAPAAGQRLQFSDQPLTLAVRNAAGTGKTPLTYGFQVATDPAFGNLIYSKDGVAEGPGGQTSFQIDKLPGSKDYFWRARAVSGGLQGPFTAARSFSIGPEVVLQAPVLSAPAPNGNAYGSATLTVNDVARSGPTGQIFYDFQVSDSPSFGNIIFEASVPEQPGQTSTQVTSQLNTNQTYYWRVQATDPSNSITGPFSPASSFRYIAFDLHQATMVNSPYNFADWAETSHVTSVVFTGDAMLVDFDRRDGPNRWIDTPFGTGSLEYTLGMCVNINHWYCSAPVQFWYGRELSASGRPDQVGREWFYDPARWGPMAGYQPSEGEMVGFFACAGNCRNNVAGDASYIKERTNVAMVAFTYGQANYTFSKGRTTTVSKGRTVVTKRR